MMKSNAYFLSRIQTFNYFIGNMEATREKNSPRELLKVGYVDESIREQVNDEIITNQKFISDTEKLTFTDLTTFNTWFVMHPEKVAGKEIVTTSMNFPLKIVGDKDLIIKTIRQGMENKGNSFAIESTISPERAKETQKRVNEMKAFMKIKPNNQENPKLKLLKLKLQLQTQTLELLLKL